jgi:hypothetical protein
VNSKSKIKAVQKVTKETHKMAPAALKCLRDAVREELRKKALLGQYVIINRNGKPCRVSAKEALKISKSK